MAARPITLLSDYGTDDEFAGVCHAVIARIAPDARVIDLTHGIRRHALGEGAFVLARSLPYAEPGVHVAVVDPGVGSPRRALAVRTKDEDRVLVGPDNGLLIPALESFGGPAEVVDISLSPFRLEAVSASFHGRDVFAPVAAHLASGATLSEAGEEVDAASLQPSPLPSPEFGDDGVLTQVVAVDRFGNAALNLSHEDLPRTGLRLGRPVRMVAGDIDRELPFALTFSDVEVGEAILYEDSYRAVAVAVNRGSAAEQLALQPGVEVRLSPA